MISGHLEHGELAGRIQQKTVVVDAHAHFYPPYDVIQFAESAVTNLRLEALDALGVLFLAARGNDHPLRAIHQAIKAKRGSWRIVRTEESTSSILVGADRPKLVLLASRQIATLEGLEVLAVGTDARLPNGTSLEDTVRAIHECHAIPVLPWGWGKWWFTRGRIVRTLLRDARSTFDSPLFLGDVAGRPYWLPFDLPGELRTAFLTLHGSDPLPIRYAEGGVGRMASRWDCRVHLDRPCESIMSSLRRMTHRPAVVGRRDMLVAAAGNQLRLRIPFGERFASRPTASDVPFRKSFYRYR